MVLGILQMGIPLDQRTFETKTFMSIEGTAFLWMVMGVVVGTAWLIFSWMVGFAAGYRGQILTDSGFNGVMCAGFVTGATATFVQWARIFTASRTQRCPA